MNLMIFIHIVRSINISWIRIPSISRSESIFLLIIPRFKSIMASGYVSIKKLYDHMDVIRDFSI